MVPKLSNSFERHIAPHKPVKIGPKMDKNWLVSCVPCSSAMFKVENFTIGNGNEPFRHLRFQKTCHLEKKIFCECTPLVPLCESRKWNLIATIRHPFCHIYECHISPGTRSRKKVHVTRDDGSQRFLVTTNYELPQTALQGLAVGLKLFIKVLAKMSQKCLHRLTLGNGASKIVPPRRERRYQLRLPAPLKPSSPASLPASEPASRISFLPI